MQLHLEPRPVIFLTDSLSVITKLQNINPNSNLNYIEGEIVKLCAALRTSGRQFRLIWVKSHAGIVGNELVDSYAKEATKKPTIDIQTPVYLPSDLRRRLREEMLKEWQDTYDRYPSGETYSSRAKTRHNAGSRVQRRLRPKALSSRRRDDLKGKTTRIDVLDLILTVDSEGKSDVVPKRHRDGPVVVEGVLPVPKRLAGFDAANQLDHVHRKGRLGRRADGGDPSLLRSANCARFVSSPLPPSVHIDPVLLVHRTLLADLLPSSRVWSIRLVRRRK
ncbi:hypothetical protein GE061_020058 [Apolygus lucorum]|uniref:RNase H type-1 domain-containing protein n=1 Tax=Apolygus lucorum TaxID=248454 RepID=A0A8S9XAA4_APOLU|nr:hypothetical protein GE061_020058 [Apolygus lucorum]